MTPGMTKRPLRSCLLDVLAAVRVQAERQQAATAVAVAGSGLRGAIAAADESVRIVGRGLQAVAVRAGRPRRALLPLRPLLALRSCRAGITLWSGWSRGPGRANGTR